MSQTELQRFAAAVQTDPTLVRRYDTATTPADVAALLRRDGYDVTDAEIEEAARLGRELPDEQLDLVTGGGILVGGLVVLGIVAALGTAAVAGAVAGSRSGS